MRYIITLLGLVYLSSCTAVVVGGIAVGSIVFVRNDFALFQSNLARKVQSLIKSELSFIHSDLTNDVTIVQEGDKMYAVGTVSSSAIKEKVENILNRHFHGSHTSEIEISTIQRDTIRDLYLKLKIKNVMFMTKYVRSGNYTVLVYNDKAYVLGHAKNDVEAQSITNSLSQISDIEDIVAYIL